MTGEMLGVTEGLSLVVSVEGLQPGGFLEGVRVGQRLCSVDVHCRILSFRCGFNLKGKQMKRS